MVSARSACFASFPLVSNFVNNFTIKVSMSTIVVQSPLHLKFIPICSQLHHGMMRSTSFVRIKSTCCLVHQLHHPSNKRILLVFPSQDQHSKMCLEIRHVRERWLPDEMNRIPSSNKLCTGRLRLYFMHPKKTSLLSTLKRCQKFTSLIQPI